MSSIPADSSFSFTKLKFEPPRHAWARNDPRGPEYGVWHVVPRHGHNGVFASAAFKPASVGTTPCFIINFETPVDFERWVEHTF